MSLSRPMITGMLLVAPVALVAGTMLVGAAAADRADRVEDTKPAAKAAPAFRFLAYEDFAGKFHLNWKPVRLDDTHVSLTKNPGKLTITTQQGTIHADEKARNEPSAKNIFVIDNPLSKDVDFAVTTSVSSFTPAVAYQQAALIIYDDDDNYLKWSYE